MLPFLGAELEVQALLGGTRGRARGTRREKGGGPLFERDGDAKQVAGILRPVLDLGEDRRQLQAEGGRWGGRLYVVAP